MTEPMKTPQLEDGFTRIANELFEAILVFGFTQRQMAVLFAIIRKTYGYGKKEDDISASQIGALCNIRRNHVTETITQLVRLNVLTKRPGSFGLIIGINKSYSSWCKKADSARPISGLVPDKDCPEPGPGTIVPSRDIDSPRMGQPDSPASGRTKENLSKENRQKKAGGQKVAFDDWIASCSANEITLIPENHAVFTYAETIGLPVHYVELCWLEFKARFSADTKTRQIDWPRHFQNYVRKNYFHLWFNKDSQWQLTTRGIQLEIEMRACQ